jgi:aspartate/methionine/tyrosine aminotransferase
VPILDLTVSNPTTVGLRFAHGILAPLASDAGLVYAPEPFGLEEARRAIAREYARRAVDVAPDRIVLTSSTSEAYTYLFRLLCDPGDEILVPAPSYPLFEHLARLDAVSAVPYQLDEAGGWAIHADAAAAAITRRTRAVIVVSPNNPTGTYLKQRELDSLAALCAERSLALVGDEVFFEYALNAPGDRASVLWQRAVLTFALGGLSKSAGLPQVKLSWIAAGGRATLVETALERLEMIADTYLSVAAPVQHAAPALFEAGEARRAHIQVRIERNHATLRRLATSHPACRVLPVEGGWSAVVQVPATRSEEELALALLEEDHVLVHPGYFFDFPREAFLIVSLLPAPEPFDDGVRRMLARASQ